MMRHVILHASHSTIARNPGSATSTVKVSKLVQSLGRDKQAGCQSSGADLVDWRLELHVEVDSLRNSGSAELQRSWGRPKVWATSGEDYRRTTWKPANTAV